MNRHLHSRVKVCFQLLVQIQQHVLRMPRHSSHRLLRQILVHLSLLRNGRDQCKSIIALELIELLLVLDLN